MLDGSKSWAASEKIVSYEWTFTDESRASRLKIERKYAKPGSYSEILKVTDDAGHTDTAPVVITATRATSSAPATAGGSACLTRVVFDASAPPPNTPSGNSSGGGGGGVFDPSTLVLTLLAAALSGAGRYARRSAASSHSRCARR